ncbi:MAG: hypothetical protein AMXMBFR13_22710 [Phycisphaerae bacterium]
MQISNAIAWGQLQLRGGWKNVLSTTAAYFAILGALILGSLRLDPGSIGAILDGWTMGLMGLQVGVVLYGLWSVGTAIRKDVTGHMIESHRLMPVSGTEAVAGYILGSGSQAIALGLVNLLLGMVTAGGASRFMPFSFLKANLILGVFAASAAIVLAFLPLVMPRAVTVLFGLLWIAGIGHEVLPGLVPGPTLLIGPAVGETLIGTVWSGRITLGQQVSMACQLLAALLCYVGAVRKYRRDDVLAFGPLLGLVVVAAHTAISATGIVFWEVTRPRLWRMERIEPEAQLTIALLAGLLLALLPVSAAAWEYTLWRRREDLKDPTPHRRPIPILPVVAAAAMLVVVMAPLSGWGNSELANRIAQAVPPPPGTLANLSGADLKDRMIAPFDTEAVVRTAIIMFAFLLSASYLYRLCYRREMRTRWIMGLFIGVTWLGPGAIDFLIYGAMQQFKGNHVFRQVSGSSPLIAMIYLWGDLDRAGENARHFSTNLGITVQLALAAGMAALYHLVFRRRGVAPTAAAAG